MTELFESATRWIRNEGKKALVFCLCLSSATLSSGCFLQKHLVLDKTVLKINDTEITAQAFAERLAQRLKHQDALHAKDDSVLDRAKEETVKAYILEVIGRTYAKKNGISVSPKELDAKVSEIRSRYPDDIAFRRALAEENLSLDKWREELEFTVLQRKIFEKITAGMPEPTDAEMLSFYEKNKAQFQTPARVRLRQIVLEKEDDAKRLMDELSDGADMTKLARQFSVAPEGENGGDTGWIDKGTLEVFDQAFKMNVGTRSKILKSPYGYHIYDVLKKEPEARLSFQEAKAKIRAQLREQSEQAVFSAWLEEQVRKTSVKRDDALIRAIKVTTRGS
jgi:peptidyl-prolyl cis-trans isomerase C